MPAHDALFQCPRTRRVFLKQFQIVIGFQNDGVRAARAFDNELRRVPEIREHRNGLGLVSNREADRILRVMGNAEGFND